MRSLALLVLALTSALASGCTPRGFFHDRWADAKDVVTVSMGTGLGAKARVGLLSAGAFVNNDFVGLRAGQGFCTSPSFSSFSLFSRSARPSNVWEVSLFPWWFEGYEVCVVNNEPYDGRKSVGVWGVLIGFPVGEGDGLADDAGHYTQLEVAAGIGGTLRLGFNPGELLDFLLGWTTLDIFGDDLEARKEREKAKKAAKKEPEAPSPPPPAPPDPKS